MKFGQLAILFLGALPLAGQTKGIVPPDILYARCKDSVVTILTFDVNRGPVSQGSGFIVDKNRVVTNYHVVAGSVSASIIFSDGTISKVTAVDAASAPKDLVILETVTGSRSLSSWEMSCSLRSAMRSTQSVLQAVSPPACRMALSAPSAKMRGNS